MTEIVEFPAPAKPEPKERMIFICNCGCTTHLLDTEGKAQCSACGAEAFLKIDPEVIEGDGSDVKPWSYTDFGDQELPRQRMLSRMKEPDAIFGFTIRQAGGYTYWFGGETVDQFEWLLRKIDEMREMIVGERDRMASEDRKENKS